MANWLNTYCPYFTQSYSSNVEVGSPSIGLKDLDK